MDRHPNPAVPSSSKGSQTLLRKVHIFFSSGDAVYPCHFQCPAKFKNKLDYYIAFYMKLFVYTNTNIKKMYIKLYKQFNF